MSNFTPTTNPSPETSFFSRSVDISQMADTTADNMRRSTVESVPGNASHPSLSPRHVPPPVPRSQLSDSSQLSVQDLSLSHSCALRGCHILSILSPLLDIVIYSLNRLVFADLDYVYFDQVVCSVYIEAKRAKLFLAQTVFRSSCRL